MFVFASVPHNSNWLLSNIYKPVVTKLRVQLAVEDRLIPHHDINVKAAVSELRLRTRSPHDLRYSSRTVVCVVQMNRTMPLVLLSIYAACSCLIDVHSNGRVGMRAREDREEFDDTGNRRCSLALLEVCSNILIAEKKRLHRSFI